MNDQEPPLEENPIHKALVSFVGSTGADAGMLILVSAESPDARVYAAGLDREAAMLWIQKVYEQIRGVEAGEDAIDRTLRLLRNGVKEVEDA